MAGPSGKHTGNIPTTRPAGRGLAGILAAMLTFRYTRKRLRGGLGLALTYEERPGGGGRYILALSRVGVYPSNTEIGIVFNLLCDLVEPAAIVMTWPGPGEIVTDRAGDHHYIKRITWSG